MANLVAVFGEVRRVLRSDGVLWLNIGDSYARAGGTGRFGPNASVGNTQSGEQRRKCDPPPGLKSKDLCMIPARVALALQADGWYLRSDVIWCLSGGTHLYAKTQKGLQVCMVRDLARLDPATVQLWNGQKWTQLLGMNKSARRGDEIEITLRSGERVSATPTHKWPTQRGLLETSDLRLGDVLQTVTLPGPDACRDCAIDEDAAWFAGLYIAEGSRSGRTIQIAGHAKETARWERLQRIAAKFGGQITRTVDGNKMDIRLYGKVLFALLDELVSGKTCKDKCFSPAVWQYSNGFLSAMVDGYLSGDGHFDAKNNRWRLGFTRNYNLERDLRTACARLGYHLILNKTTATFDGKQWPTFRGELRKERSGHHNQSEAGEIVGLAKAKCREVYDLGVADDPHLFALASGVLTHNSKPNTMPESVTDRPSSAHEHVFLLTNNERYFYDGFAIREAAVRPGDTQTFGGEKSRHYTPEATDPNFRNGHEQWGRTVTSGQTRNCRDVWTIPTQTQGFSYDFEGADFLDGSYIPRKVSEDCPVHGREAELRRLSREDAYECSCGISQVSHFAAFPEKLVEPCLKAGSSDRACSECGAAWKRQTETVVAVSKSCPKTQIAHEASGGVGVPVGTVGKSGGGRIDGYMKTLGFSPSCTCNKDDDKIAKGIVPGSIVIDPFCGSGTTGRVALRLGRRFLGCELNESYVQMARRRIASYQVKPVRPRKADDKLQSLLF